MNEERNPQSGTDSSHAHEHEDTNAHEPGPTDARETLEDASDDVPRGSDGDTKSREPEYYGDR